jgi:hypothetical protein
MSRRRQCWRLSANQARRQSWHNESKLDNESFKGAAAAVAGGATSIMLACPR